MSADNMLCYLPQILVLTVPSTWNQEQWYNASIAIPGEEASQMCSVLLSSIFEFPCYSLSSQICDPSPGVAQRHPGTARVDFMKCGRRDLSPTRASMTLRPSKNSGAHYKLSFLGHLIPRVGERATGDPTSWLSCLLCPPFSLPPTSTLKYTAKGREGGLLDYFI